MDYTAVPDHWKQEKKPETCCYAVYISGYEQLLKAIWNTLAIEVSSGKQTALDWIPS